jgi:hypothetical protein
MNNIPQNIKDVPSMSSNPLVDMFLTYQFLKRINTPFEEWDAYKLGIIDKQGKVIKKRKQLKTAQQRAAWGYFDIVTSNIKKLMAKVPGGQSQVGTLATSYLLMKESEEKQLSEEQVQQLCEDVFGIASMNAGDSSGAGVTPANNIGQGNVKLYDPLLPKVKKILRRKKPNVGA